MKANLYIVSLFVSLSIIVFSGCEDDDCPDVQNPRCEDYDPCFGRDAEPENLDFSINNVLGLTGNLATGDTMIDEWRVMFVPLFKADEYEWHIGAEADPRFGDSLAVNFVGFSGDIRVQLIARQLCRQNVVREDVMVKSFHLVDVGSLASESTILPIHGEYRGNIENRDGEDFTISITPAPEGYRRGINNLPPECGDRLTNGLFPLLYAPAWKSFYVAGNGYFSRPVCYPTGTGQLSEDNSILTIDFMYFEQDADGNYIDRTDTIWKRFIGIRI